MSQYNKLQKKYYAQNWSDDHATYSARTGKETSGSDGADIWGNIVLLFEQFVNWILSIFGSGKETLSADNTLPSQTADGFVYKAGMSDTAKLLLVSAAAGLLIFTPKKKGKKGKKNAKA